MESIKVCACMGPPGDCPCIREARGLKVEILETSISQELFALLSDTEKRLINTLKRKALGLWLHQKEGSQLQLDDEEQLAQLRSEALVKTCECGHTFLYLPDHPSHEGRACCPHCMADDIAKATVQVTKIEERLGKLELEHRETL